MIEFEDLHYDQEPTLFSVKQDLARIAKQIHQNVIPGWRAMFQAGQDPRPNMVAIANGLLGRMARARDFFTANPSELTAIATLMGKTEQQVQDAIAMRAATVITFRDATKNTINQTKAVVDALAAGFPTPKTPSAVPMFVYNPLPATW